MAKDTYYFKHDSNARNDLKLIKVRRKYKMEGYGTYFALIEILREQSEHKLPLADMPDLAYDLSVSEKIISSVINDFGLFIVESDVFYSDSLLRRMSDFNEQKERRIAAGKEGAKLRWDKEKKQSHSNRIALPKQSHGTPIAIDYTTLHYTTLDYTTLNKTKELTAWAFDIFWQMYGKSHDKTKCLDKFCKLDVLEWEKIFKQLPEYVKSTPDVQFRKNPLTYLNGKCWNDEPISTTPPKYILTEDDKY